MEKEQNKPKNKITITYTIESNDRLKFETAKALFKNYEGQIEHLNEGSTIKDHIWLTMTSETKQADEE